MPTTPPAPAAAATSSASSRCRPVNEARSRGSVRVAAAAPPGTVRSGGNSPGRPATTSWKIRTGPSRSFSRCTPRSPSAAPGGRAPATSAADASDTSTWPP